MAANSKSDLACCSPDRLTYPAGHRGAYASAPLPGSYRESLESRILSSLPNMSRSSTTLSRGDVLNFFHGLPYESKQLATGHKLSRQGDLNRVMTATVGLSAGDLSSGSLNTKHLVASSFDELKRVKTSLHDNSVKARNRLKMLNETTSKFDKCFQNILPRKRSRSDVASSDWENSLLVDRTVFGGIAKVGTQSQASAFDTETPKLEEKTKNIVPSKRTRTSLLDVQMDVRANALGRSHGSMERDREMLGLASAVQSDEKEHTLVNGFDSWEKSRMKKKRSAIKSEYSTSTVLNRPLDGDKESKRDMQQRLGTDVRSRSSIAQGIRSGPSNGVGKLNVKTGLGMRSALKNNQDNGNLNDRRDHIVGSDKERVNLKALNRSHIHENSYSSPSTKANTVTRAPRSGAGSIPKASADSPRSTEVADEWELSNLNKFHTAAGANNRKRTPPARSSSPPVAQWAGQRPQKIPRVARRSNSVRPIVGHGETPALDTVSHTFGNDNGLGIQKRSSGNGLQQVKLKCDLTSSAALSESEESGAAEIKSKDKSRKSGEVDEKGALNIPKVATQIMLSRKNKEIDDEIVGQGGGVRRQGRTLRGFSKSRSGNPLSVEKRNDAVTAKQLRSARLGIDNNESKTGRPPTRKLSDRRAYTRPRPSLNAGAPDFHGESDDGHEELLVAANAAIDSGRACSSSLWRQKEPYFSFVSAEDISYLKQQGDCVLTPTYSAAGGDSTTVGEGFGLTEYEGDYRFTSGQLQEHTGTSPPSLYQRMLSAFIVEEEDENFCGRGNEDMELDGYGSKFEPNVELNCDSWNEQLLGNIQTVGRPASNGYRVTATPRYLEELENDDLSCADVMEDMNVEAIANYSSSLNGFQPDQPQMPSIACTNSQYNQMSIGKRLLLEVQSIGIFPDQMSEDEELSAEISRLKEKLHGEVSKKTQLLRKLENSVTEAREIQERDIERRSVTVD